MVQTPLDAPSAIRADLRSLARRRQVVVLAYTASLMIIGVAFWMAPAKPTALARDGSWIISLVGIFAGATVTTAALIGLPLWRHRAFRWVTLGGLALVVSGLALVMDWGRGPTLGIPCALYGTAVSAASLAVLGFSSGLLWRRFPDPWLTLAVATAGVGVLALHFSCGGSDPVHLGFHLAPIIVIYGIARFLESRLKPQSL